MTTTNSIRIIFLTLLFRSAGGDHGTMHTTNFKDFVLRPELLSAIAECGFETPSQVQHECIPVAMHGTDIICQARSGMGKTAVFVLASLHLMDVSPEKEGQLQVLVLCHTRELAYQINKEYQRFSKHLKPDISGVFIGGNYPCPRSIFRSIFYKYY